MRFLWIVMLALVVNSSYAELAEDVVEYSLPDMSGEMRSLEEYRGKWVIVNFWATWCPPCLEEMPDLDDFHSRHKDKDAVVIGVNYEDIGHAQLAAFLDEYLIGYPIWRSDPIADTPLGSVPGLPTTYIIAPDGSVVARQVGPITAEHLDGYIKRKQVALDAK